MDEASARLLTVKRLICWWPEGPSRSELAHLLVAPASERDAAVDLMNLRALVDRDPDRALYRYLLARQLYARSRFGEVVELLSRPPGREPLPDVRFDREQARMLGAARFRIGDYAGADAVFEQLARDPELGEGARLDALDWRARCAFAAGHAS
jgi:hypothetical protein